MDRNPEDADAPRIPAPRRRRGLARELLPPLLILGIAGSILAYRAAAPRWDGVGPIGWSRPVAEPAPAAATGPSHLAGPGKLVVREKVAPAPTPTPTPKPEAKPEPPAPEPVALAKAEPTPDPEPPAPRPEPEVSPAMVKADLAMEAEKKRHEAADAQMLRQSVAARGRLEQLRRAGKVATDPKTARDERREFLTQLQRAVRDGGQRAPEMVRELESRFRREPSPVASDRFVRVQQAGSIQRLARDQKVLLLRRIDLPEPIILDILAREVVQRVGTRQGPKSRDEALLVAARQLLHVPLAPPDPAPPPDRPVAAAPPPLPAR